VFQFDEKRCGFWVTTTALLYNFTLLFFVTHDTDLVGWGIRVVFIFYKLFTTLIVYQFYKQLNCNDEESSGVSKWKGYWAKWKSYWVKDADRNDTPRLPTVKPTSHNDPY